MAVALRVTHARDPDQRFQGRRQIGSAAPVVALLLPSPEPLLPMPLLAGPELPAVS